MSDVGYKEGAMTMPENEKTDPKLLVVGLGGASMVGKTELTTKFRYPNGKSVDLVIPESSLVLSDLGQTMAWLANRKIQPDPLLLEEKLRAYGVRRSGLALETDFEENSQSLEAAVIRLGQTCVGVVEFEMGAMSGAMSAAKEVVAMLKEEDDKCVAYLRSGGQDLDKRIQQQHYSESLNYIINWLGGDEDSDEGKPVDAIAEHLDVLGSHLDQPIESGSHPEKR